VSAIAQARQRAVTSAPARTRLRCVVILLLLLAAPARADSPLDALATDDPPALTRAVTAIEALADAPGTADARFAAARACEERLADPRRALALYDAILRDTPDDRVAGAARHRADHLRAELGEGGAHAAETAALARLIATADARPPAEVRRDAEALAAATWPGAPEAQLFLGEWLRRRGEPLAALVSLEAVVARWPSSPSAAIAHREATAAAIEAGAWDRATALAEALPHDDPADRLIHDELLAAARDGRRDHRFALAAAIALAVVSLGLLAAAAAAVRRLGLRALRPPGEVLYLGPVLALLLSVALTATPLILPAVASIGGGGLALAWLSGATLDAARARGRHLRRRAVLQALACVVGVVALAYLAITRDGLLELLIETLRAGPEG
jgi:hypothetical protein